MTVAELIEALAKFDPRLPVRYEDYEQGPTDVEDISLASYRHAELKMPRPFTEDDYVTLS
jgi:hypothetical protein